MTTADISIKRLKKGLEENASVRDVPYHCLRLHSSRVWQICHAIGATREWHVGNSSRRHPVFEQPHNARAHQ
jgi:hypothetical protein